MGTRELEIDKEDFTDCLETQKLIVERLYKKIDELKHYRLKVPIYSSVANFGLLTLSLSAELQNVLPLMMLAAIFAIGLISIISLTVVRRSFTDNFLRLKWMYENKLDVPGSFAEPADEIWNMLYLLIFFGSALPAGVLISELLM